MKILNYASVLLALLLFIDHILCMQHEKELIRLMMDIDQYSEERDDVSLVIIHLKVRLFISHYNIGSV